jgi:hypothetical protein
MDETIKHRLPVDPRERRAELERRSAPDPNRPRLSTIDEATLRPVERKAAEAYANAEDAVDHLVQFAEDVGSGEISMDGVVVAPLEDDDSLVTHLEEIRSHLQR